MAVLREGSNLSSNIMKLLLPERTRRGALCSQPKVNWKPLFISASAFLNSSVCSPVSECSTATDSESSNSRSPSPFSLCRCHDLCHRDVLERETHPLTHPRVLRETESFCRHLERFARERTWEMHEVRQRGQRGSWGLGQGGSTDTRFPLAHPWPGLHLRSGYLVNRQS